MPINLDGQAPQCDGIVGVPLDYTVVEQGKVPIFWGDNQVLRNTDSMYDYPSEMTKHSTLSVPKVGRFLYTFEEDSDKINTWNNAQADDCEGDGEPDGGGGCQDNVDQYGAYVTIENCYPSFSVSQWVGHEFDSFSSYSSPCSGDNYWTTKALYGNESPIGNPCSATIRVYGVTWPLPPGYFNGTNLGTQQSFLYYEGPGRDYKPSLADIAKYWLPRIISYGGCCGDGGPPVSPPPPPPPPTDQTGCGIEVDD